MIDGNVWPSIWNRSAFLVALYVSKWLLPRHSGAPAVLSPASSAGGPGMTMIFCWHTTA